MKISNRVFGAGVFLLAVFIASATVDAKQEQAIDLSKIAEPVITKELQLEIEATNKYLQVEGVKTNEKTASYKNSQYELSKVYTDVSSTSQGAQAIVGASLWTYNFRQKSIKSAAQASQLADEYNAKMNSIQVLQNARIIELLEQLNKTKTANK
jgi:hypothetical protein